jgi:hypothetical protein
MGLMFLDQMVAKSAWVVWDECADCSSEKFAYQFWDKHTPTALLTLPRDFAINLSEKFASQ